MAPAGARRKAPRSLPVQMSHAKEPERARPLVRDTPGSAESDRGTNCAAALSRSDWFAEWEESRAARDPGLPSDARRTDRFRCSAPKAELLEWWVSICRWLPHALRM